MSFPKSLENDFACWRDCGCIPDVFPIEINAMFDGTQVQHLFAGMVLYSFKKFDIAATHFRIATKKDQKSMSCTMEMGVFHRVCRRKFKEDLFVVMFERPDQFVEILQSHFEDTHKYDTPEDPVCCSLENTVIECPMCYASIWTCELQNHAVNDCLNMLVICHKCNCLTPRCDYDNHLVTFHAPPKLQISFSESRKGTSGVLTYKTENLDFSDRFDVDRDFHDSCKAMYMGKDSCLVNARGKCHLSQRDNKITVSIVRESATITVYIDNSACKEAFEKVFSHFEDV